MDVWITAGFRDGKAAEDAANALTRSGFAVDDLSVIMTEATRLRHFTMDESRAASGDAEPIAGGTVLAVAAGLTATGSIAVIGSRENVTGPLVAGPLAVSLAALRPGSIDDGIAGALTAAGIPDQQAREIERHLSDGEIILAVRADENATGAATRALQAGAAEGSPAQASGERMHERSLDRE